MSYVEFKLYIKSERLTVETLLSWSSPGVVGTEDRTESALGSGGVVQNEFEREAVEGTEDTEPEKLAGRSISLLDTSRTSSRTLEPESLWAMEDSGREVKSSHTRNLFL